MSSNVGSSHAGQRGDRSAGGGPWTWYAASSAWRAVCHNQRRLRRSSAAIDDCARQGLTWRRFCPELPRADPGYLQLVIILLVLLLVVWAVLAVIGLAFKGLIWLFVIGLILFIGTGIIGWLGRRSSSRRQQ